MKHPRTPPPNQPTPIASTIWRLADSIVLTGITQTEHGPIPLATHVEDQPVALAFTDPDEIRALLPDGYKLFQIQVAEFLANLPVEFGLVIDPRSANPIMVGPDARDAVIAAAVPFPFEAYARVKETADGPPEFLDAARAALLAAGGVRRAFCTWYRVADCREKLLVVYDCEPGRDAAAANAVIEAAAAVRLAEPMQVTALGDVPDPFRETVEGLEPFLPGAS